MTARTIDVLGRRAVPARVLLGRLAARVRESLEDSGDLATVQELVAGLVERGTGAARQRDAFRERGRLEDVVRLLADHTVPPPVSP